MKQQSITVSDKRIDKFYFDEKYYVSTHIHGSQKLLTNAILALSGSPDNDNSSC